MKTSFSFIILLLFYLNINAQTKRDEYSLVFYNVENLFDVKNDPLTSDDEFTPEGERHWTNGRLQKKLQNTYKAIISCSGWDLPALIALCEVENRYVLEQLRNETPLNSVPYKIIHKESSDFRGIDVALLYNSNVFYPIAYEYFPLQDKNGATLKSREILLVSGVLGGKDTLHIFVNHWPSRYSGVMETRALRNGAAKLLHEKVALVRKENEMAKIIIVGDFNDQPEDASLTQYLMAQEIEDELQPKALYNLSAAWKKTGEGTLKYRSQWFVFDQVIVSGELLKSQSGISTKPGWARICRSPFLLEQDKTHGGKKLSRTYTGFKYNGGFSDHFPVLLKLKGN